MLYRDEKLKRIVHNQIRLVWQTAAASKQRTLWLGGLATLAWMTWVVQLPPPQNAKSLIPHVVAFTLACSINETIKQNWSKAHNVQKRTLALSKQLRSTDQADDLREIHREATQLERQFLFPARQKD